MKWQRLVPVMVVGALLLGSAMVQPALAQLRDSEPGSFLVFPLFDIASGNATKIRITNNGSTTRDVRLAWICPGTTAEQGTPRPFCDSFDSRLTLTSHATIVKDVASQLFPTCSAGFLVAFAQDANARPISWNQLTGSYQVIYGGADTTAEAAQAIAIQSTQGALSVLGSDDGNGNLAVQFGTPVAPATQVDYQALPNTLLGDFAAIGGFLSPPTGAATEVDTRLILLTLDIFTGAANQTARAAISTWDQLENGAFSASREFICWDRFGSAAPASASLALKKAPVGPLATDYGSLRITFNSVGNGYNPAGLGAIEEVSALTGAATTRGNTIRNLFHVSSKSSKFFTDNQ
jgi:hypothetical protein